MVVFTEKVTKNMQNRSLTYCEIEKREIKNNIQIYMEQQVSHPDDLQSNSISQKD